MTLQQTVMRKLDFEHPGRREKYGQRPQVQRDAGDAWGDGELLIAKLSSMTSRFIAEVLTRS